MNAQEYLAYFDVTYAPKLSEYVQFDRSAGFRTIFETLLAKKQSNFRILETGTLRKADVWTDGQSSLLFYDFITRFGGSLTSIDADHMALAVCEHVLTKQVRPPKEGELRLLHGDSVAVLETLREPFDLIYLDSMDLDLKNPLPSMVHHLKELASLHGVIEQSPGLVLAVDDTYGPIGKGAFIAAWAQQTKKKFLHQGYQVVVQL